MKQHDSSVRALGLKIRIGLILAFAAIVFADTSPLSRAWNDFMVRVLISDALSADQVTIVDIDDRSLAAIGRWPWTRSELAAFVGLLAVNEPRAIGVDLFFPEDGDPDDPILVESLTTTPNVVLAVAFDFESAQRIGQLPNSTAIESSSAIEPPIEPEIGWIGFFPSLADAIAPARYGHVNIQPGPDGVVRHLTGQVLIDSMEVKSFPEQLVHLVQGEQSLVLGDGHHSVPYVFDPRALTTVSALDVLEGTAPLELLKDRVLIVGSSAAGLADRVSTPLGIALPGVALQAMTIEAWLQGAVWIDAAWISEIVVWGAAVFGVVSLVAVPRLAQSRWVIFYAVCAALILLLNGLHRWWGSQIWDPMPAVLVCVAVAVALIYQLYTAQKIAAGQVRAMFQSYVPSTVLDQLLSGDVSRFDQGERARVTILFADLVGFTPYAEASEPRELTQTMRHVFNVLTESILKHGGTVDKYMGDGVMAFWGAPLEDPNQASNAVRCALDMQAAIEALPYGLTLGVGINTGEVTVGNMGSDFRHAYSVLGDAVNVAARIEGQTRSLGHPILLGHETAIECGHTTQSLGKITVKGKRACVEVFCLQSH